MCLLLESNLFFRQYQLFLEVNEGSVLTEIKTKMIPYYELKKLIQTTPKNTLSYLGYITEIWRRMMLGISPMIFVFLGIGYGSIKTRAIKMSAALISFFVVLIYWLTFTAAIVAICDYHLNPIFGMMLPNLVLIAFAVPGFKSSLW